MSPVMNLFVIHTTRGRVLYVTDRRSLDELHEALDADGCITFTNDHLYEGDESAERGELVIDQADIKSLTLPEDQEGLYARILDQ